MERADSASKSLLDTIFTYIGSIANERDMDRLLILLADMGRDLINADRCTVWLLDEKADTLWSKVAHGVDRITIPKDVGVAGSVAKNGKPLIINDPYNDPRFDKEVDKNTGYVTKNILALPIQNGEGMTIGVFQAINKLTGPKEFTDSDLEHLLLAATYTGKTIEAAQLQEEIDTTQREMIFTLAETCEMRSKETSNHVKRVAEYSMLFALAYGLGESEAMLLKLASPLHDIGKIAIPDSILLKPGKLTAAEWEIMQTHATLGYDMLKHSERKILKSSATVALQHHERWDGKGYPRRIAGNDIHIFGRISAIADVFDALGSDRVYKKAWEMDRIVDLLKEERGRQFEPKLVDIFLENVDEFNDVKETYKDDFSHFRVEKA
jgi:HD-GYP domain-containing protein (c-di-GMP phosphodiesterase class II)